MTRPFLDIVLPTLGYFLGLAVGISITIFCAGMAVDLISSPVEMAWEDAQ